METILYVGPGGDPLGAADVPGARLLDDGSLSFARPGDPAWKRDRRLVVLWDASEAIAYARSRPVDLLVLDTRGADGDTFPASSAGRVLAGVYPDRDLTGAIPRDRVVGLVSAGPAGVQAAYELGRHQIGQVLVDPTRPDLFAAVNEILSRRRIGRIALCLAGGGIEGLFYELGVLRALEAFLVDRSVVDFDLFCGISAGAVLGAFLANGVGPDEIARGMQGASARIEPVARGAMFDPNLKEVTQRALGLARGLLRRGGTPRGLLSELSRAIPNAAFAGDRLEHWLERQLARPGMSNDFSRLRRPLYVGATNQDTSEAIVFGMPGTEHVPIHRAVRASAALIPFYAPVEIEGRWYIDGAFSRTTNMRVAVDRGATLVIIVDPLVPVSAHEAGYVRRRGGMFGTMQGLKALINGRFDKAVVAIREMFPDVAFHLFRPEGDEMRILSGSPMKYFYRREVEEIAYERTLAKIRAVLPRMTREFGRHGVTFRDPAASTAAAPTEGRLDPGDLGVGV